MTRGDSDFLNAGPFNKAVEDLDGAVQSSVAEVNTEKEGKAKRANIKLNPVERIRRYLCDGGTVPEDEELHTCAYCGHHGTVDEPKGNTEKRARNLVKMMAWQEAKEAFKVQKTDGGGAARVGVKGKEVTRAPPTPKYEPVAIVCHCHQMWNPSLS